MVFPVVMYACESWTIKKVERQRIDAFELWCWRRLLRVPWTAKRSNQSILKEISPEHSLELLILKLNIGTTDTEAERPVFWTPDANDQLIGKDPDAGTNEGRKRRGGQRLRSLDGITDPMHMSLSKLRRQ